MALAIRKAGRLKSEIQLSQALIEFESVLDQKQKQNLDNLKKQSPPRANAPLALTCLLDRTVGGKRCLGPRALSILQNTQQFCSIVDVFVGGSQNIIASSIWGVVRLSLLIGSNYAQYFEKLSVMLMEIGRSCPQIREFASLYIESKHLQKLLCEYFATILGLCRDIVLFSRKPFVTQLPQLILPFDSQFKEVKNNLTQLSTNIRDEVQLASSRLQKQESTSNAQERRENARFRSFAAKFREQSLIEVRRKRLQQQRLEFLNTLPRYDHTTAWRQARSKGNVKWIFEDSTFIEWQNHTQSTFLCLVGTLGSGKTVLQASIIADASLHSRSHCVAYFFCKFDETQSLKAQTIIGSIVQQLLSGLEFTVPERAFNASDIEDTTAFLDDTLSRDTNRKNTICLDGLDDCEESERDQVLMFLQQLTNRRPSRFDLNFCCSIRPDGLATIDRWFPDRLNIGVSGVGHEAEITQYIQASLEELLERKALTLTDPALILTIRDTLKTKANGMYLWIYFLLQALCEQPTDEAIMSTLEDLPKDLHDTFKRILNRNKKTVAIAHNIFEFVAVAERPMNTEELREVLAVEPGKLSLKSDLMLNDVSKTVLQCGGGLLMIDEQNLTVQFTHESVRQFFTHGIENEPDASTYHVNIEHASLDLGLRCITYLNLGIFDTQLTKGLDTTLWKDITPQKLVQNSLPKNKMMTRVALSLLRSPQDMQSDISKHFEQIGLLTRPHKKPTYDFLAYAKFYVFVHTKSLVQCDLNMESLFHRIVNGQLAFVPTPWSGSSALSPESNSYTWAIENAHIGVLHRVIRSRSLTPLGIHTSCDKEKVHIPDQLVQELFKLAFVNKKSKVLEFLLQRLSIESQSRTELLWPTIAHNASFLHYLELPDSHSLKDLVSFQREGNLSEYGYDLAPRNMSIPNKGAFNIIESGGSDWNVITLSAACNSTAVIDYIESAYGESKLSRKQALDLLIGGLREAACRGHTTVFKRILKSYPIDTVQQWSDQPPQCHFDEYGWDPLGYAAALPGFDTPASLLSKYNTRRSHHRMTYSPVEIADWAQKNAGWVLDHRKHRESDKEVHGTFPQEPRQPVPSPPYWSRTRALAVNPGHPVELHEIQSPERFKVLNTFSSGPKPTNADFVFDTYQNGNAPQNVKEPSPQIHQDYFPSEYDEVKLPYPEEYPLDYILKRTNKEQLVFEPHSPDKRSGYLDIPSRAKNQSLPPPFPDTDHLASSDSSNNETADDCFSSKADAEQSVTPNSSAFSDIPDWIKHHRPPRRSGISNRTLTRDYAEDDFLTDAPSNEIQLTDHQRDRQSFSRRRSKPLQINVAASRPGRRRNTSSQASQHAKLLRAHAAFTKAQAALVQASNAQGEKRVWWENPALVFIVLLFWPVVLLCYLSHLLKRS